MNKKRTLIDDSMMQAFADTISATKNYAGKLNIEVLPIRKIELDPENPRELSLDLEELNKELDKDDPLYEKKQEDIVSLQSLVNSIKGQGVIIPIIVYRNLDKYRLIAGERRTLASVLAGNKEIQANILSQKPEPLQLSLMQWSENIERQDLSLQERINNLKQIVSSYATSKNIQIKDVTATNISNLLGCSLPQAMNYKIAIDLPKKISDLVKLNKLKNLEKVSLIAKVSNAKQDRLIKASLEGATLKKLKEISEEQVDKSFKKVNRDNQVYFGGTNNLDAAKLIVKLLLSSKEASKIRAELEAISLNDSKSLTKVFAEIVRYFERFV